MLGEVKRCKMAGNLFNVLFNLNKFVGFEQRDPYLLRAEQINGAPVENLSDWEKFAR